MEQGAAGGSSPRVSTRLRHVHGAASCDSGSPWRHRHDGDGETGEGVSGAAAESLQQCGEHS